MNGDQNAVGALSAAVSAKSFTFQPSGLTSHFAPTIHSQDNAMAAAPSTFQSASQSIRPHATAKTSFPLAIQSINPFDRERDATQSSGPSFSGPATWALIRRLPLNTSEETLRLMMVFSKELVDVHVLPAEQSEDAGFRAALLKFKSLAGAQEARQMLDGKSNFSNDADMRVDIIGGSPNTNGRYAANVSIPSSASTTGSSANSSTASSRQPSRFNGAFAGIDKSNSVMNGVFSPTELPHPDSSASYQSIFSPQSPIGNHLTDRTCVSGKTLINEGADDDETGELLKDPVAYAENGAHASSQRRSTVPAIPVGRLAGLSLNTTAASMPATLSAYGHHSMGSLSTHANSMANGMGGSGHGLPFNQHFRTQHYPPANPADQNPPCNTLYVGNLPIDTSEEELKAMFSKQRGYKRLCFRTKQNGPMCFVEFEDVSAATKALHDLYGHPLHNSVKGGIRLSFSKNPLGVRSTQSPGQMTPGALGGINGMLNGSGSGFTTASGPPPGLAAPPGLGTTRSSFSGPSLTMGGANPYGTGSFSSPASSIWSTNYTTMTAGGPTPVLASPSSAFHPHMTGR